ncbi:M48 family metallopeptidase [Desulfoscipio gibsoniae]|nr:SprT family zinc-dependent metalloprotease [Desulfoscipio gibsoniae]
MKVNEKIEKDCKESWCPALPQLVLDGRVLNYTIKRSGKASSLRITVDAVVGIQVTAPVKYKTEVIGRIMQDKSAWVLEKMDYLSALAGCPLPRMFVDGEQFFFLGNRYTVKLHINDQIMVDTIKINDQTMFIEVPLALHQEGGAAAVRAALVKWYKNKANYILNNRINLYKEVIGVKPAKIRIKEQKHRWGSCSGKGNLNFNWHLVMAPVNVIDYVIVHELCHLKRLDHSPAFWGLVEAVLPDYQIRRRWLKRYSPVLTF